MSINVRPFTEADYAAIVRVYNACEPDDPWSEADARHRDGSWDYEKYVRLRFVADTEGGGGGGADVERGVVGYGQISHHMFAFHPRKFTIHVMVEPAARRRGAGTALYGRLLEELRARDALLCRFDVSETRAETIAFAAKREFREVARYWESRLALTTFDPVPFSGKAERIRQHGVVIAPVSDVHEMHPDWERRAYDLFATCSADEPQLDEHTIPAFETWRVRNVGDDAFVSGVSAMALDPARGNAPVGLSLIYEHAALPGVLKQSFTGVLPAYRGKGIALAMKLAGIERARALGYREIRTENDSLNAPMLRINEALGFVKQPSHVTFEKRFA